MEEFYADPILEFDIFIARFGVNIGHQIAVVIRATSLLGNIVAMFNFLSAFLLCRWGSLQKW